MVQCADATNLVVDVCALILSLHCGPLTTSFVVKLSGIPGAM